MNKTFCKFCGSSIEIENDLMSKQRLFCPHCGKAFVRDQIETPPQEDMQESKFCGGCGVELPLEADFCPQCGRKSNPKSEQTIDEKATDGTHKGKPSVKELWKNSGKLTKLLSLLWISAIVSAISTLLGCLDVKEYYALGCFGTFIFNVFFLAIDIWLYVAMMHRKSWARKTFVVLTIINVAMTLLSGFDMSFIMLSLTLISMAIQIYCVYLCFDKEVVAAYKIDSEAQGLLAVVNRHQCTAYILTLIGCAIINSVCVSMRYGSKAWGEDCTAALLAGSSNAKEDMINHLAEACEAEGYDDAYDRAKKFVEDGIRDYTSARSRSQNQESRKEYHKVRPMHVYAAANGAKFAWLKMLKIGGMIIAGVISLVCGFLSKMKQR